MQDFEGEQFADLMQTGAPAFSMFYAQCLAKQHSWLLLQSGKDSCFNVMHAKQCNVTVQSNVM